jgi:arginine/ornithine N-succinyltransferase beta subunit
VPRLVNTGTLPIALSELEIRYYFTNDAAAATGHSCTCWHADAPSSCNTLEASVVTMSPAATEADRYISMTFEDSTQVIQVGGQAGVWKVGCHDPNWYAFEQTNDYSYTGSTTLVDWNQVTVYQNGVLVWGNEP